MNFISNLLAKQRVELNCDCYALSVFEISFEANETFGLTGFQVNQTEP